MCLMQSTSSVTNCEQVFPAHVCHSTNDFRGPNVSHSFAFFKHQCPSCNLSGRHPMPLVISVTLLCLRQVLLSFFGKTAQNVRLQSVKLGVQSGIILSVTKWRNDGCFIHERDSRTWPLHKLNILVINSLREYSQWASYFFFLSPFFLKCIRNSASFASAWVEPFSSLSVFPFLSSNILYPDFFSSAF